jgi:hypothetical protein
LTPVNLTPVGGFGSKLPVHRGSQLRLDLGEYRKE